MDIDWIKVISPIIAALLTALAYILGIAIKQLVSKIARWIENKRNNEIFDAAYKVAQGIYIYLEDEYAGKIGNYGAEKMDKMCEMLHEQFPSLTIEELVSINKQVWLSFQEGFSGAYEKSIEKGTDGVIIESPPEIVLIKEGQENQEDPEEMERIDG